MKRRIAAGLAFVLAAIVLMLIIAAVKGTALAAETERTEILGMLVIRAKIKEPERPVVHDKRTAKKAERVEIEPETQEECTESEPEVEPNSPTLTYLGRYRITGYCTCSKCCGKSDGVTASGTQATVGRTCAAPKGIPFGTELYIEGLGNRIVEDRGGFESNVIDVLCEDHPACYAITGWYDVYVVEEAQDD